MKKSEFEQIAFIRLFWQWVIVLDNVYYVTELGILFASGKTRFHETHIGELRTYSETPSRSLRISIWCDNGTNELKTWAPFY